MLDEKRLTADQVKDVCAIILGGSSDDYPHPGVDSKGFVRAVQDRNNKEPKVWNPVTKKMSNWIDVAKMKHITGGGCTIM